jgi:hypothetical protein
MVVWFPGGTRLSLNLYVEAEQDPEPTADAAAHAAAAHAHAATAHAATAHATTAHLRTMSRVEEQGRAARSAQDSEQSKHPPDSAPSKVDGDDWMKPLKKPLDHDRILEGLAKRILVTAPSKVLPPFHNLSVAHGGEGGVAQHAPFNWSPYLLPSSASSTPCCCVAFLSFGQISPLSTLAYRRSWVECVPRWNSASRKPSQNASVFLNSQDI